MKFRWPLMWRSTHERWLKEMDHARQHQQKMFDESVRSMQQRHEAQIDETARRVDEVLPEFIRLEVYRDWRTRVYRCFADVDEREILLDKRAIDFVCVRIAILVRKKLFEQMRKP